MKILVIDDDRGLRRSLSMILEDAGYDVSQAGDGSDGLNKAAAEKPAMILCDVRMPEMDGVTFLEKTISLCPKTIRIILTGYADMEAAVRIIAGSARSMGLDVEEG